MQCAWPAIGLQIGKKRRWSLQGEQFLRVDRACSNWANAEEHIKRTDGYRRHGGHVLGGPLSKSGGSFYVAFRLGMTSDDVTIELLRNYKIRAGQD